MREVIQRQPPRTIGELLLDEAITRDFLLGRLADEPPPEFVVCVVDATNLRLNLRLVLELKELGLLVVAGRTAAYAARTRASTAAGSELASLPSRCRKARP